MAAADTFTDVPSGNVFHDDIAWLADAGVTKGCNPPANTQFCPSDEVTREQMAAFMHRLAENQVVDAATAQDAEMLAGNGPDAYRSIVSGSTDGDLAGELFSEETVINTVTVTAPFPGILVISGSAYVRNFSGAAVYAGLRPFVDGSPVTGSSGNAAFTILDNSAAENMAYTVATEVAAGSHEVTQSASLVDPVAALPMPGDFFVNTQILTVEWHPAGSVSLAPQGSGSGSASGQ